jgi:phage-related protein
VQKWRGVSTARNIEFFETDSGRSDVTEYIQDLSPSSAAKVMKVMDAVADTEKPPSHFFKKLQGRGELWEIRVKNHRFLGFHVPAREQGPRKLILVTAFKKQSDRTPTQEIEVALRRRDAYLCRQGALLT